MLNLAILNPAVQQYINDNLTADISAIVLQKSPFEKISSKELAQQIQAKNKVKNKLPTWFASDSVIYPPALHLSQSSSEKTALYKMQLVSGERLVDITGGFGVDAFFFSKKIKEVVHCETQALLSKIAAHNFSQLSAENNCTFIPSDGLDYLRRLNEKVDWIYADPGRRSKTGKKIYQLEDAQPNILDYKDFLLSKSKNVLLKTSPLLDIQLGINQLDNVESIQVVSVKNEVKEILWILGSASTENPPVKAVNINTSHTEVFRADLKKEKQSQPTYSRPLQYLYEPNSSLLKAGFFKVITDQFPVYKLAPNSHLYTADQSYLDFPGRRFEVKAVFSPKSTALKAITKANISVRNFPADVNRLRKKYKIKEGGDLFLFFTQTASGKNIIIKCKKADFVE